MNDPLKDRVAQEAIEWMVQIHSGDMTKDEWDSFGQWRARHESHEKACQLIENMLDNVSPLSNLPHLRNSIQSRSSRRQFIKKALGVITIGSFSGWVYDRHTPLNGVLADLHAKTGERFSAQLPDGTDITLNARSVVNVRMDDKTRTLYLKQGRIYIDVPSGKLPFRVLSDFGEVFVGNGGIFNVGLQSDGLKVSVISKKAMLFNKSHQIPEVIAGKGILMRLSDFEYYTVNPYTESSWVNGLFEISNKPVSMLVDALRDYRSGILRISEDAREMLISGIFPLDSTDEALDMLAKSLPLTITHATNYWVTITRRI